jgi:Flp pilus assembly protein TadD
LNRQIYLKGGEFRAGHYRSARKHFDQASRVAKKDRAAVLTNSAMASIALGDNRRAESLVPQALELDPKMSRF